MIAAGVSSKTSGARHIATDAICVNGKQLRIKRILIFFIRDDLDTINSVKVTAINTYGKVPVHELYKKQAQLQPYRNA